MIQNVNTGHDVFCDDATTHFYNGKRVILKGEELESHVLSQSHKFEDLQAACPTLTAYTQRSCIRAITRVRQ